MHILVTGGAGFIGSHTLIELYKAGHTALVVDNLYNSNPEALRRVAEIIGIPEVPFIEAQNGRSSVLPLNFSLVEPDSQRNSWTWKYSIYEYKDGSCRFVILVTPS